MGRRERKELEKQQARRELERLIKGRWVLEPEKNDPPLEPHRLE